MANGSNGSAVGGIGLVTVIIALVFLFVWPGPLRYEYRPWKTRGVPTIMRIDRISHHWWVYDNARWEKQ